MWWKKTLLVACIVTASIPWLRAPARANFVASPMELHFDTKAGGAETKTVYVKNRGTKPVRVKIYLSDYRIQPDTQEIDLEPGTFQGGCADWIALSLAEMELAPGQGETLRVSLRVPPGSAGTYWSKIYVEQTSKPEPRRQEKEGRSYQVFVMQRVGVRVFENVPGTRLAEAAVTNVSVAAPDGGKQRKVSVTVQNKGNSLVLCEGRVEIRDETGAVRSTLMLGDKGKFSVYPYADRVMEAVLDTPPGPGIFSALAIVDFGGDHLVAGEAVFEGAPAGGGAP